MDLLRCDECGATFTARVTVGIVHCPGCRAAIVPALSLRRRAAEYTLRLVAAQPDLDEGVKNEILKSLEAEIEKVRELQSKAAPAAPPEEPATPPEPAAPELPPPLPPRAAVPAAPEPPKPRAPPREPSVWSKLGPVFAENLLFALAAFLLVAGAVYFVTTAWTTMSGVERRLVVVGGLGVLGGILYAASRLVNRDGALPEAERLLLLVVSFLVPVAAAPAGELFSESISYALAAAAFVLGLGFLAVRATARAEDPALVPALPVAVVAFAVLVILGPRAADAPISAAAAVACALVAAARLLDRRVVPALGDRIAPLFKGGLLLGFSGLVFAGVAALSVARAGLPAATGAAVLGAILSGAAAAIALLELSLARAGRLRGDRSVPLLLTAIALGIAGSAVAAGNERGFLVATLLGTVAGIVAGLRLPGGLLLVPGLALSALAYLYLPAPIRELATRVRDFAARSLDHEPSRFPISFYGISFLPYVIAGAWFGVHLRRRDREEWARAVFGWVFLVVAGLAILSLAAGKDLRAPAAVLSALGVLLLVLAPFARMPRIALAGTLGVLGGISCGLGWLELPAGAHIAGLVAAAAGFVLLAHRLGDREDGPAILDAVALAAAAGTALVLLGLLHSLLPPGRGGGLSLGPAHALDFLGYPALAALMVVLGAIYRRPEGVALSFVPLLRAAWTGLELSGAGPGWAILALAIAASIPILLLVAAERFRERLPARPLEKELDLRAAVPGSVLAVALLTVPALRACHAAGSFPIWAPLGLLAFAALLLFSARWARQEWAAAPAVVLLPLAGIAAAGMAGGQVLLGAGILGGAAGYALAVAGAHLLERKEGEEGPLTGVVAGTLPFLAGPLLAWAVILLATERYREAPIPHGILLAAAGLLIAAASRAGLGFLDRRAPPEARGVVAVAGGLAIGLVPVGILDAFQPRPDLYPLGFLLAAAATAVAGLRRPVFGGTALVHLTLALVTALVAGVAQAGDGRLLLLAFAGIFEGSRWASRAWPRLGGLLLLLATLGGLSLALGERVLSLHPRWQPTIWLLFAAGALVAPRIPRLTLHRVPARIVAIPILAVATVAGLLFAAVVAIAEFRTSDFSPPDLVSMAVNAFAYAVAALALVGWKATAGRVLAQTIGLVVAVFAFPFLNIALHGGWHVYHRPDVEVALVALFLALRHPLARARFPYQLPLLVLLGGALLLTVGDLDDVTTPLTVLAATAAPLALFLRGEKEHWLDVHGHGILLAALVLAAYAVPKTGAPVPEIFPLFAVISALLAVGFRAAATRIPALARAEGTAVRVPATSAGLAIFFVAMNAVLLPHRPADGIAVALSLLATGVAGGAFAVAFRRTGSPTALHSAGAAAVVLYAFLAIRTPALALLDGLHLHVLAAAGLGLLLLSERVSERLRGPLRADALLAPVPAVLFAFPAILGGSMLRGNEPSALFLAAVIYGVAGLLERRPALVGVSAALVNLALFAVWREQGIVDPAFYGVPPGLTLLAGAEILRTRIPEGNRLLLLVVGATLLYGSVGIQVLNVEAPTHALVLFGLGLLTVGAGFLLDRPQYLTLGAIVTVLDVIAYLARHGFEEGFLAAGLLVMAGLTVLTVAITTSRRRRKG